MKFKHDNLWTVTVANLLYNFCESQASKVVKLSPLELAIGEELVKSRKRRRELIEDSYHRWVSQKFIILSFDQWMCLVVSPFSWILNKTLQYFAGYFELFSSNIINYRILWWLFGLNRLIQNVSKLTVWYFSWLE